MRSKTMKNKLQEKPYSTTFALSQTRQKTAARNNCPQLKNKKRQQNITLVPHKNTRAEDRIWTDDPRFTKALLYQLSYFGLIYIR